METLIRPPFRCRLDRARTGLRSVSICVLAGALLYLGPSRPAQAWKLEAERVDVPAGAFVAVTFRQTYDVTPLVFLLPSDDDPHPSALRIRNVTPTGFELVQVRPPRASSVPPYGPQPDPATVHYLAIEPGNHPLPGGGFIEAGSLATTTVQKRFGGAEGFDAVAFGPFPGGAALVGQVQSMNNEPGHAPGSPSTPFMTVAARNVGGSGAELAIELSEVVVPLPLASTETIGFVALRGGHFGTFADNGGAAIDFEAIATADNINHVCQSVFFRANYPDPMVVASKNRHDGGDGGWLRRCALSAARVGLRHDEDQARDPERNHTTESAGVVVFSQPFDAELPDTAPPPPTARTAFRLEADEVSLPAVAAGSTAFASVAFRQRYDEAPLVFLLPSGENPEPAALRVRNVTATGFEVAQVEPPGEDGVQPATSVHYLAIERGLHQLPDGTLIEAGTHETTTVVHGSGVPGPSGTDVVGAGGAFATAPAALGESQTMANESGAPPGAPSVPWLTVDLENVAPGGFEIALERSEVNDGSVTAPETVAYLLIEPGAFTPFTANDGLEVEGEAIATGASVGGPACASVAFTQSYPGPPLVIANKNSRRGNNGGWLRRCALTESEVGLLVDEDQDLDGERSHIGEQAGLLVFSRPFDADFSRLALYHMDEVDWLVAGDVGDSSGNGNHGDPVGGVATAAATPAIPGNPGTCGYGVIPANSGLGQIDAVDTGLTMQARGTIALWYQSASAWRGAGAGDRMLFDASANLGGGGADKHFFLAKRRPGTLRFRLEDSDDTVLQAETPSTNFAGGTWVHVAATWDLDAGTAAIYVNGVLQASGSATTNGTLGAIDTLYIGDNRTSGVPGGGHDGHSADGLVDEVQIFARRLSASEVAALVDDTHACAGGLDHFAIEHDGSAVTCDAEPVTIAAHLADHTLVTDFNGTVALATSTGRGDWSLVTGAGVLDNGAAGDGAASYTFAVADGGQVVLGLGNPVVETVNIDVSDGVAAEDPGEDPDLEFAEAGFIFLADGVKNAIGTQVSGKSSDLAPGAQTLELQAVRTDDETGACEAALTGDTTIEMAFECDDPTACAAAQVTVNGTAIAGNDAGAVTSFTGVSLDFGDAADSTAAFVLEYPDAGRLRLHARFELPLEDGSPSGSFMAGTSNGFVVRPFGFDIDFDDDRATNGTSGASFAADADGSLFAVAAEPFEATVTAVAWQAEDDLDADGEPDAGADLTDNPATESFGREATPATVDVSHRLVAPSAGVAGALAGGIGVGGFAAGSAIASLAWDEVGIIDLEALHGDYLGGGAVRGTVANVGRFYPARLALSDNGPTLRNGLDAAWTCAFTYLDQPFAYLVEPVITLEAQNASGDPTDNYGGEGGAEDFWKFDSAPLLANRAYADTSGASAPLDAPAAGTATLGAAGDYDARGTLTVTGDEFAYRRETVPEAPFGALITLTLPPGDLVDRDGVCHSSALPSCDVNAGDTGDAYTIADIAGAALRFGRLALDNAFGSELVALPMPLRAEYFDGAALVVNADDDCTALSLALDVELTNPASGTRAGDQAMIVGAGTTRIGSGDPSLAAGESPLVFEPPGAGNTGFVDVLVDLAGAGQAWLEYDWDGDGAHDDPPSARASFGLFSGSGRIIYQREPWPSP